MRSGTCSHSDTSWARCENSTWSICACSRDALGNPQRRFAGILIAGTNGKGSTAATLASILEAAGHRTGLYTSPHLQRINERIRVNGEEISDPEFAEMHKRVEKIATELVAHGKLPHPPSFLRR